MRTRVMLVPFEEPVKRSPNRRTLQPSASRRLAAQRLETLSQEAGACRTCAPVNAQPTRFPVFVLALWVVAVSLASVADRNGSARALWRYGLAFASQPPTSAPLRGPRVG